MRGFICNAGVYLMEIPRQVDHMFLSNGNRAELLVKCTAPAGKRYVLAAGSDFSPFGANFTNSAAAVDSLVQPVVATIEVQATQASSMQKSKVTQRCVRATARACAVAHCLARVDTTRCSQAAGARNHANLS